MNEATKIMNDYLEKSQKMPTGKAQLGAGPAQGEGQSLKGKGKTGGGKGRKAGGLEPPTGLNETAKTEKLSEDDEDVDKQLKTTKEKPIARGKKQVVQKSLTPAAQRQMVAKEHAQAVHQLTKGNDIQYQTGIPTPKQEKPALQKSGYHATSPGSLVGYSFDSDNQVAHYLENGPTEPSITHVPPPMAIGQDCPACNGTFSKSLTACPDCGHGTVRHQVVRVTTPKTKQGGLRPATKTQLVFKD